MFRFEDEPHDDGTCVHEAVESMVGEIVDVCAILACIGTLVVTVARLVESLT